MLPDDAFVSYRIVSKAVEAMLTGMSRSICATHRRWLNLLRGHAIMTNNNVLFTIPIPSAIGAKC
jgi:hypothetical protein